MLSTVFISGDAGLGSCPLKFEFNHKIMLSTVFISGNNAGLWLNFCVG
jgi:hypothetical protein